MCVGISGVYSSVDYRLMKHAVMLMIIITIMIMITKIYFASIMLMPSIFFGLMIVVIVLTLNN